MFGDSVKLPMFSARADIFYRILAESLFLNPRSATVRVLNEGAKKMIPSQTWFPTNLQDRVAWYNRFANNFAEIAASLGFTNAEITTTNDDNEVMQFLGATDLEIEAYVSAVGKYRKGITEGKVGTTTPAFPANLTLNLPKTVTTGIFERLDKLVTKIKAADNYTEEIGALLGILPTQKESVNLNERKPTLKLEELHTGYKFNASVGNRDRFSFKIQICYANSEEWHDAGFGTKNPLEVSVTPTAAGKPERIQVRAVLMDNNKPVGQPSDIQYLTINP